MDEIVLMIEAYSNFKQSCKTRYLDWEKARELCLEHPNCSIWAGIIEDIGNTGGEIYDHGEWCDGYVYDRSFWGTPSLQIFEDGAEEPLEVPCWTYDEHEYSGVPDWWLIRGAE